MGAETTDLHEILQQWKNGLRERQIAHWRISASFDRYSKFLGGSAAIFAALVGTGIIGGLANGTNFWGQAVFATLSLSSALLAALQTFLDYPTRSIAHATAAVEFGSIRRECELLLTENSDAATLPGRAQTLRTAWSEAEKKAPTLDQTIFNEIRTGHAPKAKDPT